MRFFFIPCAVFILVFGANAQAKMRSMMSADYVLEDDQSEISVRADGSSIAVSTSRWVPLNEEGKQFLAQYKIMFDPEFSKVRFITGRTLAPSKFPAFYGAGAFRTGMAENRPSVDVSPKTLSVRDIGIAEKGMTAMKALIIPFTDLQIRSTAEYKIEQTSKPLIPSVYNQTFIYGSDFPEIKGLTVIRSVKPLLFHVQDDHHALEVKAFRDGALYGLSIELKRATYVRPEEEIQASLDVGAFPRVDVSTAAVWNDISKPLSQVYEREIAKPLPPLFAQIANDAAKIKNRDDQMNFAVRSLISKLTYAGVWITKQGKFYPRGHQTVSASKTGDCKDFATSIAAIFRKLGYQASVALTVRAAPTAEYMRNAPQIRSVPGSNYFNHAIVHVKLDDGTDRWIDPTNLIVNVSALFSDIQNAPALILNQNTQNLSVLPGAPLTDSTQSTTISNRQDGTTVVTGTLKLPQDSASEVFSMLKQSGPAQAEQILKSVTTAGFGKREDVSVIYDRGYQGSGSLNVQFSFTARSSEMMGPNQTNMLAAYPLRTFTMLSASPDRTFDLYLGAPGVDRNETVVQGLRSKGDVSSDCFVRSRWIDVDRQVRDRNGTIVISDVVEQKISVITAQEMRLEEFSDVMRSIQSCISKTAVALQPPARDSKTILLTEMTREKALAAVEKMESG
ncbi:MAG: hypothetical protein EOP06_09040, partial [Proteobacteria bacterium]